LADVFLGHQIVILELWVGTTLDDASAHLRFLVRIAKIYDGNRNAWITLRVLAFERGCFGTDQEEVAFARHPDGSAVWRAIGHKRGQMREVGPVDQFLNLNGKRNAHTLIS